jgi:hypothetical protein
MMMKDKGGDVPDLFEEEEEEPEFRQLRRYFRKKSIRKKPTRWRKRPRC